MRTNKQDDIEAMKADIGKDAKLIHLYENTDKLRDKIAEIICIHECNEYGEKYKGACLTCKELADQILSLFEPVELKTLGDEKIKFALNVKALDSLGDGVV